MATIEESTVETPVVDQEATEKAPAPIETPEAAKTAAAETIAAYLPVAIEKLRALLEGTNKEKIERARAVVELIRNDLSDAVFRENGNRQSRALKDTRFDHLFAEATQVLKVQSGVDRKFPQIDMKVWRRKAAFKNGI